MGCNGIETFERIFIQRQKTTPVLFIGYIVVLSLVLPIII